MAYTYRKMKHLPNTPRREDSVGPALSVECSYKPHAFGPGRIPPARLKNFKEVIAGRISFITPILLHLH